MIFSYKSNQKRTFARKADVRTSPRETPPKAEISATLSKIRINFFKIDPYLINNRHAGLSPDRKHVFVDSFLNAAMLMGGMGPVRALHLDYGKLFAGIYALYCGFVLIIAVGISAAPIVHRFLITSRWKAQGINPISRMNSRKTEKCKMSGIPLPEP